MNGIGVSHYRAAWSLSENHGLITLILVDGNEEIVAGLSAETFHAIVDILRNEGPVYWVPSARMITTLSETIGEGEKK